MSTTPRTDAIEDPLTGLTREVQSACDLIDQLRADNTALREALTSARNKAFFAGCGPLTHEKACVEICERLNAALGKNPNPSGVRTTPAAAETSRPEGAGCVSGVLQQEPEFILDDVADRLRYGAQCPVSGPGGDLAKDMLEGAAEIKHLRSLLREALPFVEHDHAATAYRTTVAERGQRALAGCVSMVELPKFKRYSIDWARRDVFESPNGTWVDHADLAGCVFAVGKQEGK